MIYAETYSVIKIKNSGTNRHVLLGTLFILAVVLTACGNKEKKAGQALVRVNNEEITILQVNDELQRAGVQASQQEAASKQLLESLIDRQLILAEAERNKLDRTPEVMQAIERARVQIIAQAFLQGITTKTPRPSRIEIDNYYQEHPEYFAKRKEFDLKQLVISNKNFNDELKSFLDTAKSLDEIATWMDKHGVQYTRSQATRTTADLPADAVAKLVEMPLGKLFLVGEADNKVINVLTAIKDSPVTALNAAPQIEQFLFNKKIKEAAAVEIAHLRSLAKIEYLGASAPTAQSSAIVPNSASGTGAVSPK